MPAVVALRFLGAHEVGWRAWPAWAGRASALARPPLVQARVGCSRACVHHVKFLWQRAPAVT
jgi:hypothetical protein